MRALRLQYYVAMLVADAIAVMLAMTLGSLLRFDTPFSPEAATLILGLVPFFCFFDLANMRPDYLNDWRRSIVSMTIALGKAVLVLLFFGFLLHAIGDASRLLVGYGVMLALVVALVLRALLVTLSTRAFQGARSITSC